MLFFDRMEENNPPRSYNAIEVDEAKMDALSYEVMFIELCSVGMMDEVMKMVSCMLDDARIELNSDIEKIIKEGLRKAGREEELSRLIEQRKEAKKIAEELERTKARARVAILKRLCEEGKVDEWMKKGYDMLVDASVEPNSDMEEIIKDGQRRGGAAEVDEWMKKGYDMLVDASVEPNSDMEEIIKDGQRRGGAAEAY